FRTHEALSRQHVALLLFKAQRYVAIRPEEVKQELQKYKDVDENHDYATEIATLSYYGVFKGNNGLFKGNNSITREQMASVLVKAYDLEQYGTRHINTKGVDPSHLDNVKILGHNNITSEVDDFRPMENITRGQFATFLDKTRV